MSSTLSALIRGDGDWSTDLNLSLARFTLLGITAYIVGFFPVQLSAAQGVLTDASLIIFSATYIAISIVNATYLVYEVRVEEYDADLIPLSVRGYSIHLMTLAYATSVAYLVTLF